MAVVNFLTDYKFLNLSITRISEVDVSQKENAELIEAID